MTPIVKDKISSYDKQLFITGIEKANNKIFCIAIYKKVLTQAGFLFNMLCIWNSFQSKYKAPFSFWQWKKLQNGFFFFLSFFFPFCPFFFLSFFFLCVFFLSFFLSFTAYEVKMLECRVIEGKGHKAHYITNQRY